MDVALVQDAEHDVDRQECGQDQEWLSSERGLERLGRPLQAASNIRRQADLPHGCFHRLHRFAERDAGRQIERHRDCRKLPLVVHREGRRSLFVMRKGTQRHLGARRRAHIHVVEGIGTLPKPRFELHHDMILVEGGVHDRDLSLAERIVQGVINKLGRDI